MRKTCFRKKVNKLAKCHNLRKTWTPQRRFRGKRLYLEILNFNLVSTSIVYTRIWVLWFSKIDKSISYSWIFGWKKGYLALSEKGSWFDQPSKIGEEHNWQATGASSSHGARRKKVKGNLPKKSKILWEPLPSTSQDYSSSSDLENFEEEEASSKIWTIIERKLLNHHVLEQSASCRFCESDSVLKFWRSGKHWSWRRMGMRFPKNSRTTILRLTEQKLRIHFQISTSAESNFPAWPQKL